MFIKHGREIGLFLFIVLIMLLLGMRNPKFFSIENLDDMLKSTAILSILALGMLLVMVTQGIDLSIASNMALSGMLTSILVRDYPNILTIIPVTVGLLVGAVNGFLNGLLITKGRILPIIVTLGMMYISRGMTFVISQGKWVSSYQFTDQFLSLSNGRFLGINNLIVIAILLYIFFIFFIKYTPTGRRIYAVGSSEESAYINGLNTHRLVILVYTIMGLLAGLCGILWVARFASAQSDSAIGYEFTVIAACVLGGVSLQGGYGKISGVFLGVILLGILQNALPLINISPFWQNALQGTIILFAVISNVLSERKIKRAALRSQHR